MALNLDTIRATAERVAASHQLNVVDLDIQNSGKFRTLRVFLEKNAEERAKLAERVKAAKEAEAAGLEFEADPTIPSGVAVETLSGVTHEDCATFAQDFGTVLDVEDLMPGAEYTLEVSSPGIERKLATPEDFTRFTGNLVKVQTFSPVSNNRHWQGRLTSFANGVLTLDLAAVKQKGKAKKAATAPVIEIPLANVEKAQLVAEF